MNSIDAITQQEAGTAKNAKPTQPSPKAISRIVVGRKKRVRRLPARRPSNIARRKALMAVEAFTLLRPMTASRKSAPQTSRHHSMATDKKITTQKAQ